MNNPGLNNILKYLKSEEERYLRAYKSGMFCDGENCLKTAQAIRWTIWELEDAMKSFKFDLSDKEVCKGLL